LELLEEECLTHGKVATVIDFETGPVEGVIGASEPSVTFGAQTVDDLANLLYANDHDGTLPRGGAQFAVPDRGIATVEMTFETAQTLVLLGFAGYETAAWGSYLTSLLSDGVLVAEGPTFGATDPLGGWAFRGFLSLANVGFDQLVLGSGSEDEFLYLDDVWFCE